MKRLQMLGATLLVTVAAMAATPIVKGMKNMKHDCMGQSCNQSTVTKGEQIAFADPTIVRKGGYYYLTGTANQKPQGFSMLVSKDLKTGHRWADCSQKALRCMATRASGLRSYILTAKHGSWLIRLMSRWL